MRGKRPKERKCYVLRAGDGTVVEVTREVYLEWYQSRRRERYQNERKQKYGVSSLEALSEKGILPDGRADGPEEMVIRELCVEKLRSVMEELAEADAYLLYLLFFEEVTVKEAAQLCGCSRKTIANRRKRILRELNEKLKAMGIMGGCF
ncbi:RNA polymerase sigma factor [uncultured Roseburia sp.]|uniref:Sigma-70 family RNA polymerase sigma factor n=1 Tax=Brotonthovivens ammoniilytica TaxID=2981725 RepID=A0ABT2TJW7_9FIRM|nr:sigma-70 family RNA polymerase sigma factor [Brotonthovivens ammoniilytica]MCU6761927.1 sigma-70 family RNA polymerase sigma factor [Brotonthovivens ammoniilytica]SCI50831.1 RNA polymerase sigma factor [uncultured Roseburia sp.]